MGSMVIVNDGRPLHHTDHGGSGPVVVLLHSFLMDERMFASQIAALRSEFRLVTVDERGHGGTPADAPFDYWDVARDVLALLDHLGVDNAAVAGTSQGGFVALRMALLAPDRVTALAVIARRERPRTHRSPRRTGSSPRAGRRTGRRTSCWTPSPASAWARCRRTTGRRRGGAFPAIGCSAS
ncbi:MAG TPA: alpha/beta hydrolase [Pseudonocardia sp.]